MLTQTLVEHLFLYWLALLVNEHPVGELTVPAQTVTTHLDTVLTTEVGNAVSQTEIPHTLFRMNLAWFPSILSCHAAKLFLDNCSLNRIRDIELVHSHTNGEIIFVSLLQSRACRVVNRTSPLSRCCDATGNKR